VESVTDRTSNPFGMRIEDAVYGYGDDNAAFHVVGDRPLEYALREHTNHWADLPHDATELYAEEVRAGVSSSFPSPTRTSGPRPRSGR
jgi:hypothetical protein